MPKKGLWPCVAADSSQVQGLFFSSSFSPGPATVFPFPSNYALAALPLLENICMQLPVEATRPPPPLIQLCWQEPCDIPKQLPG